MISVKQYTNGEKQLYYDVRCLSTDAKPTNVPNGSTCIEINTGKAFLFNETGKTWVEIPQGSQVVINPASGVSF